MKVRLLKIMAGPEIEAAYPGDVVEVPDSVGANLISSQVAEPVAGENKAFVPEELEVKAKETKSKGKHGKHEKMLATDPRSELL